jgi:hypothetical protein
LEAAGQVPGRLSLAPWSWAGFQEDLLEGKSSPLPGSLTPAMRAGMG